MHDELSALVDLAVQYDDSQYGTRKPQSEKRAERFRRLHAATKAAEKRKWEARAARKRAAREERDAKMTEEERQAYIAMTQRKRDERAAWLREQDAKLAWALEHGPHVAIDCAYDDIMNKLELNSLAMQISRSFGWNKAAPSPVALHVCGISDVFSACLAKQNAHLWKARLHEETVFDVFPDQEIVFLSPDAPEVLREFDPRAVYVIGGIVDRTVRKCTSLYRARDWNVRCMQLPVREYCDIKLNPQHTIDQVFGILAHLNGGKSMREAFTTMLPARKMVLRDESGEADKAGDASAAAHASDDACASAGDEVVDASSDGGSSDRGDDDDDADARAAPPCVSDASSSV